MNHYKSVADRQADTMTILKEEMKKLLRNFNPFIKNAGIIMADELKVTLLKALDLAYSENYCFTNNKEGYYFYAEAHQKGN